MRLVPLLSLSAPLYPTVHTILTSPLPPNSEHNTTARLLNTHLSLSSPSSSSKPPTPLTPLHDLSTDRPIRHFPKHERDIRTMGPSEVIQVLQALGVKSLGMSAAEKKGEVRAQTGLPREAEKEGVVEKGEGEGKAEVPKTKTVPKVAPGSTAEKVGKMGTATAKGVGKPVVGGKAGEEKKP